MKDPKNSSYDLENGLIGSILLDPTVLDQAREIVQIDDFVTDDLRTTYSRMLQLHAAGQSVNVVDVANLSRSGGASGPQLAAAMRTAIPETALPSARIIRQRAIGREIRRITHRAEELAAQEGIDPFELLRDVQEQLDAISSRHTPGRARSIQQLLPESLESIRRAVELYAAGEKVPGVPTGFTDLDIRFGGWQETELIVLAARPGMGKTSLALQFAEAGARSGVPTLFVSLEMGFRQLLARLYSARTAFPVEDIIRGRMFGPEVDQVLQAAEELAELPLYIDDEDSTDLEDVRTRIRRYHREKGIGLVVVDYLQLISAKGETRANEIDGVARGLKVLARSLEIPIVALSQLNRDVTKRSSKRPQLQDLKESGGIEEAADIVAFIHRPYAYQDDTAQLDERGTPRPTDYAEVITAKFRNGTPGIDALTWDAGHTRFLDPYDKARGLEDRQRWDDDE
jgi:replicative DNA helicase